MTEKEWEKPAFKSILGWIRLFFAGICVGAADIVPGISGGTVAFILGIYEDLLKSISTLNASAFKVLFQGKFRAFFDKIAWQFLVAIFFGVAVAFLTLAKCFLFLLNNEVYRMWLYSCFIGLVAGSIIYCSKQLAKWSYMHFFALLFSAVVAYFLTGADLMPQPKKGSLYHVPIEKRLESHENAIENFDFSSNTLLNVPESYLSAMIAKKVIEKEALITRVSDNVALPAKDALGSIAVEFIDPWILCCGALAISAMLLPGISGSYLLTVLGMYGFILSALLDFLHGLKSFMWDMNAFRVVFSMALGIVLGALLFSRVVLYLLDRYRDVTLASLIGFMVGAMRAVWPFWTYSYEFHPLHLFEGPKLRALEAVVPVVSGEVLVAPLFAAGGFLLVLVVERLAKSQKAAQM